jgi:glycyl-tRNA synthetase (class II)
VTIRDRDTMLQERIPAGEISGIVRGRMG